MLGFGAMAGLAGISALGNIGGSLVSGYFNKKSQQAQNKANIDAWNMQNAYNDPSAQMERLKKAGLNPNLVYSGNAVGNSSADLKLGGVDSSYKNLGQGISDSFESFQNNMFKAMNQEDKDAMIENAKNNLRVREIDSETKIFKALNEQINAINKFNETVRHNKETEKPTSIRTYEYVKDKSSNFLDAWKRDLEDPKNYNKVDARVYRYLKKKFNWK